MKLNSRWAEKERSDYVFLRAPSYEQEILKRVMAIVLGNGPDIRISRLGGGNLLWMHSGVKKQDAVRIDELMEVVCGKETS